MSRQKNFKKLEESKLISSCVLCMACSLKKDLLATGTTNGEVVLNRAGCTWHKVWTLAPITSEAKPKSLAFRPDSKALAIGYDIGKLVLCTIEKSSIIHTHELGNSISVSRLVWLEINVGSDVGFVNLPPVNDFQYTDCQNVFLPKLPPNPSKSTGMLDTSKKDDYVEDAKGLKGQEQVLSILLQCDSNGFLTIYGYGLLKLIRLSFGLNHTIHSVCMCEDMSSLSALVLNTETGLLSSHLVHGMTLREQYRNIRILSFQYGYCLYLLEYLQSTLKMMLEQWEDGLSLLERHLTKVALDIRKSYVSDGSDPGSVPVVPTVSDDLVNLLVFGECSEQLLMCLQHDLTDKVIRKLGSATESSYNNLLKLILRYLMLVSHTLFYRVSDVKALCRLPEGIVTAGVEPSCVTRAQSTLAAFMMKTTELHEVIEKSLKIFKAFFKFLNTWSLRLSNEPVPGEMSCMSEEEIWSVSEFLREQSDKERSSTSEQMRKKNLSFDRVRQYLRNSDLKYPEKRPNHEWSKLKMSLLAKQTQELIYPDSPSKSLIQLHKQFVKDIEAIYQLPYEKFTNMMKSRQTESINIGIDKFDIGVESSRESRCEPKADSSEGTGHAGPKSPVFVGNQCILKEYLYTVIITKHKERENCLFITRQSIDVVSSDVLVLKLLSSEPVSHANIETRFEDVNFFVHNRHIENSLCILLSIKEVWRKDSPAVVERKPTTANNAGDGMVDIDMSESDAQPSNGQNDKRDISGAEQFIPHLLMVPLSALIPHMLAIPSTAATDSCNISQLVSGVREVPTLSVHSICGVTMQKLDNMLASQLIVNSDRNVICVLHSFRRRFRIFEFGDIEDSDGADESADISNTTIG